MSDSEDPVDLPEEGGDDLFGDGGGDDDDVLSQSDKGRSPGDNDALSDHGGGYGELLEEDYETPQVKNKVVMSIPMYRHRIPRSKDGQVSRITFNPSNLKPFACSS